MLLYSDRRHDSSPLSGISSKGPYLFLKTEGLADAKGASAYIDVGAYWGNCSMDAFKFRLTSIFDDVLKFIYTLEFCRSCIYLLNYNNWSEAYCIYSSSSMFVEVCLYISISNYFILESLLTLSIFKTEF